MSVRGHRAVDHTADEQLEAWGPTRAACLEEAVSGLVDLFAAPSRAAPRRRHVVDLPGDDDTTLLLDVLSEIIFLADAEAAVPCAVEVADGRDRVEIAFELVDLGNAEMTGPAPKGVSFSGLGLDDEDGRWVARALIDI